MWELLTNAIGAFFNAARTLLPGIAGRILVGLGIGVTSYAFLVPEILGWIQNFFDVLSPDVRAMLGAMNVDNACNLIISAINAKFAMKLTPIRLNNPT